MEKIPNSLDNTPSDSEGDKKTETNEDTANELPREEALKKPKIEYTGDQDLYSDPKTGEIVSRETLLERMKYRRDEQA